MRRLGLIDDNGSLTDRGNKWRIDSSYADACQEILDEVYPPELASFTDQNGKPDKDQVMRYFQHQGYGNSNARQMAATYLLIAEKRVPEAPSSEPKKTTRSSSPRKAQAANGAQSADKSPAVSAPEPVLTPVNHQSNQPNVHLDIQIHIPADASVEQIDQIFASMAKHLYHS
jgi:hypothetical protein